MDVNHYTKAALHAWQAPAALPGKLLLLPGVRIWSNHPKTTGIATGVCLA
jgi:hypothetical protein